MNKNFLDLLCFLEPLCCALTLLVLYRSRESKPFRSLAVLLWFRLTSDLLSLGLLRYGTSIFGRRLDYELYFFVYWISFAVESLLSLHVIVGIFRLAMDPLKGLRTLGMLVFRWAATISLVLAVAIGFNVRFSGTQLLISIISELHQISSVLTVCLLLFVSFAIRPLGLSFKSRIFGVGLGLGLTSCVNLVCAAWLSHFPELYSIPNVAMGVVGLVSSAIWAGYFLLPEPKRRIIVLPTTSPYLRWNQISEVLGDEPGFVAIAGVPPELFASAELEIMARASAKMRAIEEYTPSSDSVTLKTLTA